MVPDLATCDLETFLQNVFQHTAVFGVSKDLALLMKPGRVSRVKDISDIQSYSDRDTNVNVNVQQNFPCDYCEKYNILSISIVICRSKLPYLCPLV